MDMIDQVRDLILSPTRAASIAGAKGRTVPHDRRGGVARVSGKVLPLRRQESAPAAPPSPWVLGEIFTRDGVEYELVTAGEIKLVELGCSEGGPPRRPPRHPATCSTFSAMPGRW
jgi:hypothetical protein